jgi:hypothetical protein
VASLRGFTIKTKNQGKGGTEKNEKKTTARRFNRLAEYAAGYHVPTHFTEQMRRSSSDNGNDHGAATKN